MTRKKKRLFHNKLKKKEKMEFTSVLLFVFGAIRALQMKVNKHHEHTEIKTQTNTDEFSSFKKGEKQDYCVCYTKHTDCRHCGSGTSHNRTDTQRHTVTVSGVFLSRGRNNSV